MPGFRPTALVIHPDAQPAYDALEAAALEKAQPAAAIWKSFRAAVARIKLDGQWGEVIPSARIPAHFRKYGLTNLYCIDLADFHRCFYTLRNRDVIFLDLVDHRKYDKWFPGRGR
ncbi:MAG: hypothetical protein ACREN5_07000 [Gemmatimonadales bacterium]